MFYHCAVMLVITQLDAAIFMIANKFRLFVMTYHVTLG